MTTPAASNDTDAGRLIAQLQQAAQLLRQGRRSEALIIYQDVRQSAGLGPAVQLQLGHLCEEIGDIDQAVTHYAAVVEEVPDNAGYLAVLGVACLNADDPDRAGETLEQALELDPDLPEVQHGLGVYYMRKADYKSAAGFLERACELRPGDANVRVNLAASLTRLNRHDEALAHIKKALRLDDSNPLAHLTYADILAQIGEIEASTAHLERLLRKQPYFGGVYDQLARNKKYSENDMPFIRKAEKVLDRGMPPKERYGLLFALGKMHDDCGHYETAFDFYEQANVLRKTSYDFARDLKLGKVLQKAFTAKTLQAFERRGHASAQPVFIVGMPRSGTTLMERIIASHPKGAGAGELPAIAQIAREVFPPAARRAAAGRILSALSAEKISEHSDSYLAILQQGREEADRIVDKMPGNFLFLGLIRALFPNATLINAMRHPLDSCLSCYFQNFSELRWTNDLELIGRTYALYRQSMDYWHEVLPAGSILDVQYEQLVEDPEIHARRMIETCGLDWDPSVLEFFRKKGVVRTASIAQTRQPIYKTSRERWINYAGHLQPLVSQLAPYLQNDREILARHGLELPHKGWLSRMKG